MVTRPDLLISGSGDRCTSLLFPVLSAPSNAAVRHREIWQTRRRSRLGFPQVGGHPVCEGREGGNGTHVANAGAMFNELEAELQATRILIARWEPTTLAKLLETIDR